MSGGLEGVGVHIRNTLFHSAWGASYGLVVGSAAGFLCRYLPTVLKISKAFTFVNVGLGLAAGQGAYWLLGHAFAKIDIIQKTPWARETVQHVALPILSVLAGITAASCASMAVYTIVAVAVGAFLLGNWLQPTREEVLQKARLKRVG